MIWFDLVFFFVWKEYYSCRFRQNGKPLCWLFKDLRPSPFVFEKNDLLEVSEGEQMFGLMPLCFATYPAIALRLAKCDEKRLKQSLSKALDLVPSAAGRFRADGDFLELRSEGLGVVFKKIGRVSRLERRVSLQTPVTEKGLGM